MNMLTALFLGAICGLIGAFAMTFFMGAVSQAFSKRVDMARALGSYFTGKAEGSGALGRAIHSFSGVFFGSIYFAIMHAMGALVFPYAIFLGIGFGFFHGLIMSYILMFFASERHPVEMYRNATLEEGLLHLVGHIIFGGVAGVLGSLISIAI